MIARTSLFAKSESHNFRDQNGCGTRTCISSVTQERLYSCKYEYIYNSYIIQQGGGECSDCSLVGFDIV